jgi:hypothetical protein
MVSQFWVPMWIDINYPISAQQLIHKINSKPLVKEKLNSSARPAPDGPLARRRAHMRDPTMRGGPWRHGPCVDAAQVGEPPRAGTIAKEPLDLSWFTRPLTTLFRQSRLSTKVLVLTLLCNGEVPDTSSPASAASSGTRRLLRPTREP